MNSMARILLALTALIALCSPARSQSLADLTKQLETQNAEHAKLAAKVSAVEARVAALEKAATVSPKPSILAAVVANAPQEVVDRPAPFKLSKESEAIGWKALDSRWCLHTTGQLYDLETGERYYPASACNCGPACSMGGNCITGNCGMAGCNGFGYSMQPAFGFGGMRGISFGGGCASGNCAGGVCR